MRETAADRSSFPCQSANSANWEASAIAPLMEVTRGTLKVGRNLRRHHEAPADDFWLNLFPRTNHPPYSHQEIHRLTISLLTVDFPST